MIDNDFITAKEGVKNKYEYTDKSKDLTLEEMADTLLEIAERKKPDAGLEEGEEAAESFDLDEIEWAVIKYGLRLVAEQGQPLYSPIAEAIAEKINQ